MEKQRGRKKQRVGTIEEINQKTILNNAEASVYTGLHLNTLKKYRLLGTKNGIRLKFIRPNQKDVLYRKKDIDEFLAKCTA